jgi:hypothetical protein
VIVMRILVASASGANGNGYGAVLGFGPEGGLPWAGSPQQAVKLARQIAARTS